MGFVNLDLSTAVFPVGAAVYDAGAITSENPYDTIEFLFPGLAMDPTKYYQFQVDIDSYNPAEAYPYWYMTSTDAGESSTSYPELGEAEDPSLSGDPVTLTVNIGPGIGDWDLYVAGFGATHPWFYFDENIRITAVRYQTMKITELSDWLDDALPVWVSRQSYPANARYVYVDSDGSPTPATVDDCWAGTGTIGSSGTSYSAFESSADVSSAFSTPSIFTCLWRQSWLTVKRTGSESTISTGILPEGSTAIDVEWEALTAPNDLRLNLLLQTTAYDQGRDWHMKIVPGLTPGDPGYAPGHVDGGDMAGLDTLVVTTPSALNQTFVVDADRLADFGIGLTGSVQFALAPVDEFTEAQSWSYGVPSPSITQKVSVSLEAGYKLRYKARFLVPDSSGPPPACRKFPRDDDLGVGSGRHHPPPTSQQRSPRRHAGSHY